MPTSYYGSFDLIRRDSAGAEIPLASFTLTIRYAGGANITTVSSDANGHVRANSLTIAEDTAIEFYDAGAKPESGVLAQTTAATALDACITNRSQQFLIDDDYATYAETDIVDIWIQDLTETGIAPKYVGSCRPGETLKVPFESYYSKSIRVYKILRDADRAQNVTDFGEADYTDFSPDASRPEDEITIGTTAIVGGTAGNLLIHGAGDLLEEIAASLADPGGDRIAFWDESANRLTWLSLGSGLSITGTTLDSAGGGLTIGGAVTGGGANRVLYQDGSDNLATSPRFVFDGNLKLVTDTNASAGTPKIGSPYLHLVGSNWRTDLSQAEAMPWRLSSKAAVSQYAHIPHSDLIFEHWAPGQNDWIQSLKIGTKPTDYLVTQLTFRNPVVAGWGGIIEVNYNGGWSFRDLAGNVAPFAFVLGGAQPEAFPTFATANSYSPHLRAYFNAPIVFDKGYPNPPGSVYSDGNGASGSEYVKSNLPMTIGGTACPSSRFEVISTTEQVRVCYDANKYYKQTVGSTGTVTFDAAGSGAEFIYDKKVKIKAGTGSNYVRPCGVLAQYYSDASPSAAATDTDAYSTTIVADTLVTNGDALHVTAGGEMVSTNIKAVRVNFAGAEIFNTDDVDWSGSWFLDVLIIRVSSTTARCIGRLSTGANEHTQYATISTGLDFTTSETLKLVLYAETDVDDVIGRICAVTLLPKT